MIETILAILLSFAPHHSDAETPAERRARMTLVAVAVDFVADDAVCEGSALRKDCRPWWPGKKRELVAAILTIGWFESRYAERIHSGKKLGDAGKAIGIWQVQANRHIRGAAWRAMGGTDYTSTVQAAYWATRIFSQAYRRCANRGKRGVQQAFSMYATGYSCEVFKQAPKRYRFYQGVKRKLWEKRK